LALAAGVVTAGAQAPVSIGVRGRSNANVSLAASGRFVAAAWAASAQTGDSDIELAVSRDAGAAFSPAVRVNATPGSARVSGEQPPRVALVPRPGKDPQIVVVWTGSGLAGTRLVSARSDDAGRTFSAESQVPGSDAAGNRGWESTAVEPSGRVDVLWLDHRAAAASSADMSHHMDHAASAPMQADSVARAQLSKLYFGALDGSANGRAIAGGVCYCCKTALAATAGGLLAAWRHVYPGNIRDIAFAMSKDGGRTFSTPVRVSQDQWAIDGCPENGPALAADSKGRIHVVWPTFVPASSGSGELALFYAMSADGKQFTPRQKIPTAGTPRHVQLAVQADGTLAIAWDESEAGRRRIAVGRATPGSAGRVEVTRQVLTALGAAQYPALAVTSGGVLVAAATGGDESVIRIARLAEASR
jgi:hypothetical protein